MERGEVREEVHITGPEQPMQTWLDEVTGDLARELGVSVETLGKLGAKVDYFELQRSPTTQREDKMAVLSYNDRPVATCLETRTLTNMVLSQMVYFGVDHGA